MTTYLAPAPGVFPLVERDAAILDTRRHGRWHLTSGTGAMLLAELAEHDGSLYAAISAMTKAFPGTPRDTVSADALEFVNRLRASGLLNAIPGPEPWPVRPPRANAVGPNAVSGPIRLVDRLLAPVALMLALAALRTGSLRLCLRLATFVSIYTSTGANAAGANSAVQAVRVAARWWPGRAACVETSLASVLVLAVHRRRVRWYIGARFAPAEFHAWIEAEGRPVAEPESGAWPYIPAVAT